MIELFKRTTPVEEKTFARADLQEALRWPALDLCHPRRPA
jgi:hypothetical protein